MGPSYLKRCAICKQCTLVWTHTPDMFRGFAASVTGPGHNRFLRVYEFFWLFMRWATDSTVKTRIWVLGKYLSGGGLSPSH